MCKTNEREYIIFLQSTSLLCWKLKNQEQYLKKFLTPHSYWVKYEKRKTSGRTVYQYLNDIEYENNCMI